MNDRVCSFIQCPLGLTIKLNFNISKEAYCLIFEQLKKSLIASYIHFLLYIAKIKGLFVFIKLLSVTFWTCSEA